MCGCSFSLALVALELAPQRSRRKDKTDAEEFVACDASPDALPACCAMSRTQLLARARARRPTRPAARHSMESETA
jgi:hypothetical protein